MLADVTTAEALARHRAEALERRHALARCRAERRTPRASHRAGTGRVGRLLGALHPARHARPAAAH